MISALTPGLFHRREVARPEQRFGSDLSDQAGEKPIRTANLVNGNCGSVAPASLRIALFSGNYNYVRDGANQALNRLVGYLLSQGHAVRVYSPTTDSPAFSPVGELISLPSRSIPKRKEYRFTTGLPASVRRDLAAFAPDILHISSPDLAARKAVGWAKRRDIAVIASIHTRFETYLSYYHLQLLEPALRALMRRLYRKCDALLVPA